MNKNIIGKRVKENRENIIKAYQNNISIYDIAIKYDVKPSTIYRWLNRWKVKIIRGTYKHERVNIKKFKREFSPELKLKMKENTGINNKHMTYCNYVNTTEEQKLISSIIKRAITG